MKRTAVMLLGIFGFGILYCSTQGRELCREYAVFMGAGCLITMGVIAAFAGVALSSGIASHVTSFLAWLRQKRPKWAEKISGWEEQVFLLGKSGKMIWEQKKRMCGVLILQTVKMLLFYGIPAVVLYQNISLSFAECILLMAVAYMLSGVIPAPSGVGALEFVFLLFFSAFTESGMAVPAILIFRFSTWIFPFMIGGGLLIYYRFHSNTL